jgi:predicted transcriptional regulator
MKFRLISKEEALNEVMRYIRSHPGCFTSEIIQELRLGPILVVEALEKLEGQGKVRGEEMEHPKA